MLDMSGWAAVHELVFMVKFLILFWGVSRIKIASSEWRWQFICQLFHDSINVLKNQALGKP